MSPTPPAVALLLLASLSAFVSACGEHDDHAHGSTTVAEEFCEHMAEGPATAVTAVDAASDAAPPSVSDDHERYDIELVPVDGGNGGAVSFAAATEGHYAIALGADVAMQAFDSSGNELTPHHRNGASALCDEVAADVGFYLEVGTATLVFGPTAETDVSVVIELDADSSTHD